MNDLEKSWFISDLHFNDCWINKSGEPRGVILFERTQFKDTEEHDSFIINALCSWAKKHRDHHLYILGDFGDPAYLPVIEMLNFCYNVRISFVTGNHDKVEDYERFSLAFTEVFTAPTFIHPRIVLSHEPLWPCPDGVINICGHLHGATLDSVNHIVVSANNIDYKPIGWKTISKRFAAIDKVSYKFLEEPYARHYKILKNRGDIVYDKKTRLIDYEESIKRFNEINNRHLVPKAKKKLEW